MRGETEIAERVARKAGMMMKRLLSRKVREKEVRKAGMMMEKLLLSKAGEHE